MGCRTKEMNQIRFGIFDSSDFEKLWLGFGWKKKKKKKGPENRKKLRVSNG